MENIDHGEIQDPPNPFALSDREAKMLIYIGRMALLGELFHDVVHDIRNPLSTVTLIASVIDKSRRSDEGDGATLAEKIRILVIFEIDVTEGVKEASKHTDLICKFNPAICRYE